MFECKKCKSTNIVCNLIETNIESGNDFYKDKEFGKVNVTIQVCWCSILNFITYNGWVYTKYPNHKL